MYVYVYVYVYAYAYVHTCVVKAEGVVAEWNVEAG